MTEHTLDIRTLDHVAFDEGGDYVTVMDATLDIQVAVSDDLDTTDALVLQCDGQEWFRGPITGWEIGSDTSIYAQRKGLQA